MFSLEEWMKDTGVSIKDISDLIGMEARQIQDIIESCNSKTQFEIYDMFVKKYSDEVLIRDHLAFYQKFIPDSSALQSWIRDIIDDADPLRRRIINNIRRMVQLSDGIQVSGRSYDSLKVFFIAVCIDFITEFKYRDTPLYRRIINFYSFNVEPLDQQLILDKFRRSCGDPIYDPTVQEGETKDDVLNRIHTSPQINMETFGRIISAIRNSVAHDGNINIFSFENGNDYKLMKFIEVEENKQEYILVKNGEPRKTRVYETVV